MGQKGKDLTELRDNEWLQDLVFMADITAYVNSLNTRLQGHNQIVTECYDHIHTFEIKLQLWEKQLSLHNLAHFPSLTSLQWHCWDSTWWHHRKVRGKIIELRKEFQEQFFDFRDHEWEFVSQCATLWWSSSFINSWDQIIPNGSPLHEEFFPCVRVCTCVNNCSPS